MMNVKRLSPLFLIGPVMVASAFAVDLARVNGKVITDKDVQSALGNLNEGQRRRILSDSNSKREIVTTLVEQELLLQEAERQKLEQEPGFREALAQFRRQTLSQRVLDKYLASRITEASARKFYALNKRKYSNDKVEILQIVAADEKGANDLMRLVKAPNADFMAIAEKNSRDPGAKNNRGYVGPIGWDAPFSTEFKEAAFEGARGEIVGPIKTAFGYHLIKVVDKKTGSTKTFDEVELVVREDMKRDLTDDYLAKVRKQSQVVVDTKALDRL